MEINEKIRKAMRDANITQKELGKKLGISQAAINKYLRKNSNPTAETIKKIADALGVPVAYFLDESISNSGVIMGNNNSNVSNVTAPHGVSESEVREMAGEITQIKKDIQILNLKMDLILERIKK